MTKHQKNRRAFTLVELLVTMAIISILTSLTVMSFKSMNGTMGLTGAGDQIGAALAFARQEALAKDTMCAVVLVTSPNAGNAAYRTLSIWELVASPDGGTTPATWVQSSKWITMPAGTIVDNTSGVSTFLTSTSLPTTFPTTINYLGTTLNPTSDCAIQIFLPSGRLIPPSANPSNPYTLQLVEGFYTGSLPTYQHPSPSNASKPANYVDYIFSTATGEPKIVRP